jgi:hypothetical protein
MATNGLCAVCVKYQHQQVAGAQTSTQIALCSACGGLVCDQHAQVRKSTGEYYCNQCIGNSVP